MGSLGIQSFQVRQSQNTKSQQHLMIPQTTFAVPLHCDSCVKDVSVALSKVDGVTTVEANLKDQLILVEGIAPPPPSWLPSNLLVEMPFYEEVESPTQPEYAY